MPICRNCKARITKFDKDICPVCGCEHPLEGVTSETIEITSQVDINNPEFKNYKPTLKNMVFMYFALIGWTGAGFFYQHFKKIGITWCIINIVVYASIGSCLAFCSELGLLWGYLIPLFGIYVLNILVGLFYLVKDDLKDGRGEFLK